MLNKKEVTHFSMCLELCPERWLEDHVCRAHVHATISFAGKQDKRTSKFLALGTTMPQDVQGGKSSTKKNRRGQKADPSHFYCQVEKNSQVWTVTDYYAHKDFHVKAEWVRNLVENEKITHQVAKDVYGRSCVDVVRNWSNLSAAQQHRKEKAMASYITMVKKTLEEKRLPVQDPPGVDAWQAQYLSCEERYKFLVL